MDNQTMIVFGQEKQLDNNSRRGFASHPENINRAGRPTRDWTWADLFVDVAEEERETKIGKLKVKKIVANKLFHMAMKGNVHAIREVIDRMDGKAEQKQQVDMTVKNPMVVFDND